MNNRKTIFVLSLFFLNSILFGQNGISNLASEINKLKNDDALKHASWSVCVRNVKTGAIISENNSVQSLVPASVMKIVSTTPALSILGQNFKFKTKIEYDGFIDSLGILHGNLYITGGGDPTLGSSRWKNTKINIVFEKWTKVLKDKGIKKITGAIIADASIFDDALIPGTWTWEDMGNYYGAGASGLSIHENYYKLIFKPSTKIGGDAKVLRTEPKMQDIKFINHVKTAKAGTGDNVIIYGSPYSKLRFLEGTVPFGKKEFTVKGSITDPAYTCVYLFNKYLSKNGINSSKHPTSVRGLKTAGKYKNQKRKTLLIYKSPSLSTIIKQANLRSINSYAEACVKILAYEKLKKGSTKDGIGIIRNFWSQKGVELEGMLMKDGSGLSRVNRITTDQISKMLCVFTKDKTYQYFYKSLSIAGSSGSLRNLFKGTYAENNLRAKSGYMKTIRAYAGYVTNKNNEQLAFAIIVNNYNCSAFQMKKKLEKLMILIAEME